MINKSNAKYPEYIKKAEEIRTQLSDELNKVKPSYGFDGDKITEICKKYAKKLKELQKEYSFLFEES